MFAEAVQLPVDKAPGALDAALHHWSCLHGFGAQSTRLHVVLSAVLFTFTLALFLKTRVDCLAFSFFSE